MKQVAVMLISVCSCLSACSNEDGSVARELEGKYWSALDRWVERGGNIDDVQDIVVENCGKPVMAGVGGKEKVALATTGREEFHFRVDVCTKMAVNRAHPQPEFDNPDTIRIVCKDSSVAIFHKLCSHSGLILSSL